VIEVGVSAGRSSGDAVARDQPDPTPLLATKLHAPRVGRYGDRPRLGTLLDRVLDDGTRLTLLSAPPGYGKSVAVAGWLGSSGVPAAWLSLDAADNDPVRFLRYLVAALRPVRPGIDRVAGALLEGGAGPESAAVLIDAMATTDDPFVLVLDDYHVITAGSVHALLRSLIEHGPPFVHLIVITREDPPFPLPRLRANRRLVEVRADELRFTAAEAAAYLADGSALDVDDAGVQRLVERTEGWIAGLQLAAISMREKPAVAEMIDAFAGSQRFVLDYLAAEVLDRLDPDLRAFLVRSSVVNRFTADLCRVLSGREDSASMLDRAEQLNLFLIPLDLERRWYRFHHLFADYLRTMLDPAEQVQLQERASDYLETEGLLEEAIDLAVKAGSTERAIRLLERQARRTYESGELSVLLGWLDALPSDRIAANPELVYLRAVACFFVGRVEDAARACDEGEAACPCDASPGPMLTACALIAAFSNRTDATAVGLAAVDAIEGDRFYLARALQALATAYLTAGELAAAGETARKALALEPRTSRSSLVVPATTALVTVLNLTGHRRDAEALCRQCLADHVAEVAHMAGGTPYALYWLGTVRYEANDIDEALDAFERSWAAAGTFGFGRALLTSSVSYLALARQASGSPERAVDAIRTVRHDARAAGLAGIEDVLDEIEARVRLMQVDLSYAAGWADRVGRQSGRDEGSHGLSRLARDVTLARVRLAQGRPQDAERSLDLARSASIAAHDAADLVSIEVLQAAIAEASGDRAAAHRALAAAIDLAAPEGYVRRVVDDGRPVARLLPAVRSGAPAFVDEVTAALARDAAPRVPTSTRRDPTPWRDGDGRLLDALTARELEVLRLMARGDGDAAIANELVVSLATAKWHAAHIRSKLGATNRTQALVRAQELGLV
jgi:LuxR family transcriptional regulator, maltose regulon positive regulatory protein